MSVSDLDPLRISFVRWLLVLTSDLEEAIPNYHQVRTAKDARTVGVRNNGG